MISGGAIGIEYSSGDDEVDAGGDCWLYAISGGVTSKMDLKSAIVDWIGGVGDEVGR